MSNKKIWPQLEKLGVEKKLNGSYKLLHDTIVCIDGLALLVKAKTVFTLDKIGDCAYNDVLWLRAIYHRLASLLKKGAYPVVIFDGKPPALKNQTLRKRGTLNFAGSWKHNENLKRLCNLLMRLGIPIIRLLVGEGEAFCAWIEKKLRDAGHSAVTMTHDSDAFLFGSERVLRLKTEKSGKGSDFYEYRMADIRAKGLDRRRLVIIGTVSGGDYSSGVEFLGPVKLLEVLPEDGDAAEALFKKWISEDPPDVKMYKQRLPHKTWIKVRNAAKTGTQFLEVLNEYWNPTLHIDSVISPERDSCMEIWLRQEAIELKWSPPNLLGESPYGISERETMSLHRHVLLVQRVGSAGRQKQVGSKHLPLAILKLRTRRFLPHLECKWDEGDQEVIEKALIEAALPDMVTRFTMEQIRLKEKKRLRSNKKAIPKVALPGQLTLNQFFITEKNISEKKKAESEYFVTPVQKPRVLVAISAAVTNKKVLRAPKVLKKQPSVPSGRRRKKARRASSGLKDKKSKETQLSAFFTPLRKPAQIELSEDQSKDALKFFMPKQPSPDITITCSTPRKRRRLIENEDVRSFPKQESADNLSTEVLPRKPRTLKRKRSPSCEETKCVVPAAEFLEHTDEYLQRPIRKRRPNILLREDCAFPRRTLVRSSKEKKSFLKLQTHTQKVSPSLRWKDSEYGKYDNAKGNYRVFNKKEYDFPRSIGEIQPNWSAKPSLEKSRLITTSSRKEPMDKLKDHALRNFKPSEQYDQKEQEFCTARPANLTPSLKHADVTDCYTAATLKRLLNTSSPKKKSNASNSLSSNQADRVENERSMDLKDF